MRATWWIGGTTTRCYEPPRVQCRAISCCGRPVRVLVVDDDVSLLALLRELVAANAQFEIAGEATSGEQAIMAARELRPDMVLMDAECRGWAG